MSVPPPLRVVIPLLFRLPEGTPAARLVRTAMDGSRRVRMFTLACRDACKAILSLRDDDQEILISRSVWVRARQFTAASRARISSMRLVVPAALMESLYDDGAMLASFLVLVSSLMTDRARTRVTIMGFREHCETRV